MALLVQRVVPARYAFVIHTTNPATGALPPRCVLHLCKDVKIAFDDTVAIVPVWYLLGILSMFTGVTVCFMKVMRAERMQSGSEASAQRKVMQYSAQLCIHLIMHFTS